MRRTVRLLCLAAIIGALVAPMASPVTADIEWPSARQARLERLDGKLLKTQHKLYKARFDNDRKKAKKFGKRLKRIEKERHQLLRDLGML